MNNVLVVIPADKEPQQAVRAAIDLAKDRAGALIALVVLDPELPARIASTFTDVGFMGEEVGTHVSDTIVHEYRARAQTFLQAVSERAKEKGVTVTPIVEQGDTGEVCSRIIRTHHVGIAVLVSEKRSWLTRFLAHGAAVKLPKLFGCEVRVMDEE